MPTWAWVARELKAGRGRGGSIVGSSYYATMKRYENGSRIVTHRYMARPDTPLKIAVVPLVPLGRAAAATEQGAVDAMVGRVDLRLDLAYYGTSWHIIAYPIASYLPATNQLRCFVHAGDVQGADTVYESTGP